MSNSKVKRRYIILLRFLVLFVVVFVGFSNLTDNKKRLYEKNAEEFIEGFNMISFDNTNAVIIEDLSDFTTFEWDYILFFGPYQSADRIVDEVGYEWTKTIITNVNEWTNQVIFVHDGEVVCHIQGYPGTYGIYFEVSIENSTGFKKLDGNRNLSFEISSRDGYYNFRYIGEE